MLPVYLLNLPNVNCDVVRMLQYGSLLSTRLMFLPVVVNRFLHVALPFSYKSVVTTKRVYLTIGSLWLVAFAIGMLSVFIQDYNLNAQYGVCAPKQGSGRFLFTLLVYGLLVVSMCIITGTSIYLRYKIINSNRTFNSVKRSSVEEHAAVKAGRLVEILQEQVKPTFTVFIAGGIDAVLNLSSIILLILIDFEAHFIILILIMQVSRHISHAVVYAIHDSNIRKEVLKVYRNIRGPKKSKVIMLNGQ